MKNIEVELRYSVKNKKKLVSWLDKNAKKVFNHHQVDEYFTPAHRNYFDRSHPTHYLRIRKSGDQSSVTFKHWHPKKDDATESSHCDEYETNVEDGEQLRKIFEKLEFKTLVVVDKKRTVYEYENFEIAIDEVDEVGVVCEIEIKGNFKSVDEAHEKLREFSKKLGFSEKDRGEDLKLGYALLIAKKKGIMPSGNNQTMSNARMLQ